MELSTDLAAWTYAMVVDLVKTHTYEPGRFDFKEVLNATHGDRNKHNENIRKEACAMANTDGGFIIFGVKDAKGMVAEDESRIIGIPVGGDHRKEFGEKLADIQPALHFDSVPRPISLPHNPESGVFVVYLPQSPYRPHMIRSEGVFYGRGEGGSVTALDYYQVRELMLSTGERLGKIALLRIEIGALRTLIATWQVQDPVKLVMSKRFDTSAVQILLADTSVLSLSLEVLHPLLTIPKTANRINGHLDMHTRGDKPPIYLDSAIRILADNAIKEMLVDFDSLCRACDNRLAALVGPQPIVEETVARFDNAIRAISSQRSEQ